MYGTASNAITSSYSQTSLSSSYTQTSLSISYSLLSERTNELNNVRIIQSGSLSIGTRDLKLIAGAGKTSDSGKLDTLEFSEIASFVLGEGVFANATYVSQGSDPLFIYEITNSGSIRISGSAGCEIMYTAWYALI
jgi:hypothetical protein